MADRYHGVWYSLLLKGIGALPWIASVDVAYMWQHGLNFTMYCLGGLAFYWMLIQLGFSRSFASLGVVLLLGHPRLWGHAVTNMKDIPFMMMWVVSVGSMLWVHDKPTVKRGAVLGCVMGATMALRIVGGLVPLLWCGVFAWRYRTQWKVVLAVVLNAAASLVVLWPFLWGNVFRVFEAVLGMSRYHWEGTMLYRGDVVWSTDLPWHYVITWMGITTPLMYGGLILLAIVKALSVLRRERAFEWDPKWGVILLWGSVMECGYDVSVPKCIF
jgi:hypothetical protein